MSCNFSNIVPFFIILFSVMRGAHAYELCSEQSVVEINNQNEFVSHFKKSTFQVLAISKSSPLIVKSLGTATLIDANGLLLTASHIFSVDNVLEDLKSGNRTLKVRIPIGNTDSAIFEADFPTIFDPSIDIASIQVKNWTNDYGFQPVKIDVRNNPQNMPARILAAC